MAGKIRVLTRLFLGTTVLAAGGGGAYYYKVHGWPQFSHTSHDKAAVADLEAVASVWAEPTSPHSAVTSDSSPVARSANTATTNPAVVPKKAEQPAEDDRYAICAVRAAADPAAKAPTAGKNDSTSAKLKNDEATKVATTDAPKTDKSSAVEEREPTPAVLDTAVVPAAHTESAGDAKPQSKGDAKTNDEESPTPAQPLRRKPIWPAAKS